MGLPVILLLAAVNILNYLDRYLTASVLPSVITEFSLSKTQGGWLIAAFVPGYVIFSPIFGYLGDRFSRPRLMCLGVVLWSAATLLTASCHSFTGFVIARILVGIGEASFGTMTPGYLKDRIGDPIKLNSALSIFYSAIPIGSALGFVTGGVVSAHYGWHLAFVCAGLPGLLLAPFLLGLREGRTEVPKQAPLKESILLILRVRLLWFVVGGYVVNSIALTGVAAFLTDYGKTINFDPDSLSTVFGLILVVAGFLGTFVGGRIASALARKDKDPIRAMLRFVGWTAMAGVPFLVGAFLFDIHWLFLLLCFLAELLIFAGMAPVNTIIVQSCPPSLTTLTQGISILLINLFGSMPAPVIVGAIADYSSSLRLGMLSLGPFLFLSAVLWLIGARPSNQILAQDRAGP